MSQVQHARQRAKKDEAEKQFDALFYSPPKSKGLPAMASKLFELQQKIDALQKERDDLLESEKSEAIENINAMVRTYGIRPRDIDFGDGSKPVSGTRAKAVAKYKSGSQTWSGRGRKPKWVENHVAKGGKLDDLLIK